MNHRIRMARKRLMVAREQRQSTLDSFCADFTNGAKWERWCRRLGTLRAIERRKDRIA